MGRLFPGWHLALRRLFASWWLTLLLGGGALLATTLLSGAPIYADALSEAGLRFHLDRSLDDPGERIAVVALDGLRLGDPASAAQRDAADAITAARVGHLGNGLLVEQRSDVLDLTPVEPPRMPWPAQARLVYLSGLENHVVVVEGRLPAPDTDRAEVLLPDGFQQIASIGDRIVLSGSTYNDCQRVPGALDLETAVDEVRCRPTTFVTPSAIAVVVGFIRPRDPGDARWQIFDDGWGVPDEAETAQPEVDRAVPLLTTRDQYVGAFTTLLPELQTRYRVGIVPDLDALTVKDISRAIDDLRVWPQEVGQPLGLTVTPPVGFVDELARFRNAQTFSRIPLLLLLLQVAGVAGFYIVATAAFMQERHAGEVALYRSRGASTTQLLGLSIIDALLIAVPAALAGPFLAAEAVKALGYTAAFEPITGGSALQAGVSGDAFLFAAGGALLAVVAMLLPAFSSARSPIVDVKRERSRPRQQGVLQQYYLDLAGVAVAGLLLWQLDRRGTVFNPQSVGGWEADPLLLLSPLILTGAVAALAMRFYPLVVRLAARALRPLRGPTIALGLGRTARDPSRAVRLMLLISTAVAVATFAASYAPTIDRSFQDRIFYETGVEARGVLVDSRLPEADDDLAAVRELEGVADAVLVYRGQIGGAGGALITLLAIDDLDRAANMLWFREDFTSEPPAELLQRIDVVPPSPGGLSLPAETVAIELAVSTQTAPRIGRIRGRLRLGDGAYRDVVFTAIEGSGWSTIRAEIPPGFQGPLTLVSLRLTDQLLFVSGDGAIHFDDLIAVRRSGDSVVLDDFEGRFNWTMYSQLASTESFVEVADTVQAGQGAARWSWTKEVAQRERVLALRDTALPLHAIMSENALDAFGASPGDRISVLVGNGFSAPVVVRGSAALFPTLDPEGGFAVVQIDQLRALAGTLAADALRSPNELWVSFNAGLPLVEQQAIMELLSDSERSPLLISEPLHRASLIAELDADPTLQASGTGILFLAVAGVIGTAILGFVVTLAVTTRDRIVELSVLRAVGLTRYGVLRAMLLEWGVVLVLGAAIGVLLGRRIARLMLTFLEVTDDGGRVVPHFLLVFDRGLLAAGLLALTGAAAIVVLVSWRLSVRRASAASLRFTQ